MSDIQHYEYSLNARYSDFLTGIEQSLSEGVSHISFGIIDDVSLESFGTRNSLDFIATSETFATPPQWGQMTYFQDSSAPYNSYMSQSSITVSGALTRQTRFFASLYSQNSYSLLPTLEEPAQSKKSRCGFEFGLQF